MDSRYNRKHKRKPTRMRTFLIAVSVIASLLVATVGYGSYQYLSGQNESRANTEENNSFTESTEQMEFSPNEPENNETVNILLIGTDADEEGPPRTDTIMIAQYSASERKAKIASIMRDSYVTIPGYRDNKINTAFTLGGPELLRQTIKDNFDLDIHYYAMIDFEGFEHVVDTVAPNGLEVNIEDRMYYQSGSVVIDFQPGPQVLDGEDALKYVRFRSDSQNDFGRVGRQQEMMQLLKDEILSISGITRIPRLIGQVEPYIDTNLTTSRILSLGRDFLLHPVESVDTMTIPISDGYSDESYSHAGDVLELDKEKNRAAIASFFGNEANEGINVASEQSESSEEEPSNY